jgi:hypothetical protein
MDTLIYSNIWDALLKLVSVAAMIIMAISLNLADRIHSAGIATQPSSEFAIFGVAVVVWVILYRQYLSTLSSWLYARVSLRTDISFKEAKALRKLFQVDLSMTWVPLREIKKLPNDQRHNSLLLALHTFGPGRKAMLL